MSCGEKGSSLRGDETRRGEERQWRIEGCWRLTRAAAQVKKMQADKNLVRVMSACETMGGCTTICSDKTGTLTQNTMAVTDGYIAGRMYDGKLPSKDDEQLAPATLKLLADAIACNSKVASTLIAEPESRP